MCVTVYVCVDVSQYVVGGLLPVCAGTGVGGSSSSPFTPMSSLYSNYCIQYYIKYITCYIQSQAVTNTYGFGLDEARLGTLACQVVGLSVMIFTID